MEGKDDLVDSLITLRDDEAPESFVVAQRCEDHSQMSGSVITTQALRVSVEAPVVVEAPVSVAPQAGTEAPASEPPEVGVAPPANVETPITMVMQKSGTKGKKKRGRPRKYGLDGSLVSMALSPMPISASIPLTGDCSAWKHSRGKPHESFKKKHKLEVDSLGHRVAYSVGVNFTPHVMTVGVGEDIMMKIMSFSQQVARAICILSANGSISNVTLRQPSSFGGTLTYEGCFEILSLTGSFMPTDNGGTKGRSGGMSISLAGSDGRVRGGGVAGLLVAGGPVQVVVASFIPGHQLEQKPKKQKFKYAAAFNLTPPSNLITWEGNALSL